MAAATLPSFTTGFSPHFAAAFPAKRFVHAVAVSCARAVAVELRRRAALICSSS